MCVAATSVVWPHMRDQVFYFAEPPQKVLSLGGLCVLSALWVDPKAASFYRATMPGRAGAHTDPGGSQEEAR